VRAGGIGGDGEELNHFSEVAMGWLAGLFLVVGLLGVFFGLIFVTKERDYAKFKPDMPAGPAKQEAFDTSVRQQKLTGMILLVGGTIALIAALPLWMSGR
jgi:hypothetical protein